MPSLAMSSPRVMDGGESGFPTVPGLTNRWFADLSDTSLLYQEPAKSTPVASGGDPIGAAEDSFGNGYTPDQATTTSKPTFITGGGATFDGGDWLSEVNATLAGYFNSAYTLSIVFSMTNTNNTLFYFKSSINQ